MRTAVYILYACGVPRKLRTAPHRDTACRIGNAYMRFIEFATRFTYRIRFLLRSSFGGRGATTTSLEIVAVWVFSMWILPVIVHTFFRTRDVFNSCMHFCIYLNSVSTLNDQSGLIKQTTTVAFVFQFLRHCARMAAPTASHVTLKTPDS